MPSCIQIEHLAKSYGDVMLFENVTFSVEEGHRVALIARNGAGKTTLLEIVAGRAAADAGCVTPRRDLRIAYLPQSPVYPPEMTVLEACFRGDDPALRAIEAYERAVASPTGEGLQEAMNRMDALDAWGYEQRAKRILSRLEIRDFSQRIGTLSGGQLKRVALAGTLICGADLLLLDEPTNHLDSDMTEWLADYLVHAPSALLMVTHDRWFLDSVCGDILELEDGGIRHYTGNYASYLEQKQAREEALAAQRASDRNLYRRELEWMRRQPQARATKAQYRIDAFHALEEKLRPVRRRGDLRLEAQASRIGTKIFECRGVKKSFGDIRILDGFDYTFTRYEKLGVVGDNGCGKSTFLKLLMGIERPDSGAIDIGETVRFGYYSQQGMDFDEGMKVLDAVQSIAEEIETGGRRISASQLLQHFLFTPEEQHGYIARLSGGERRRLYLCTVLMRNPNFLILDEPTNDLDIATLGVLEEYLESFRGCVIVVSHDRYFVDRVADHLLVFCGDGEVRDFAGSYSEYLDWKRAREAQRRAAESAPKAASAARPAAAGAGTGAGTSGAGVSSARKLSYKEQRELEALDAEIPALEAEKAALEEALSSGTLAHEELAVKAQRITDLMEEIDLKTMRWLELSERQ